MNLDYLRYFVTLAELRHYTRAAEALCITQPSLSHAIRQLEEELGVPLFQRAGRNTTLTRYGAEFLDCARRTLDTLNQGVDTLQRSARGEGLIRLGFLRPLGVRYIPELAARFLAANPGMRIQFEFHTERTQPLLDGLLRQKYDLAVCSRPAAGLPLTAVPVACQELVIVVPKDHPLAGRKSAGLADLLPYPQVYFAKGSGLREVVDGLFAAIGGVPNIAWETEEDQVIAGLVAQGFGVAVVPAMDLLNKLELAVLPISSPPYQRQFFAVSCDGVFLPPVARRFLQFMVDEGLTPILPP